MMPVFANPVPWSIRAYRLASWILILAAVHIALSESGRVLPTPPAPWNDGDLLGWLSTTDATISSFALLRLVALAIAWYLTAVTLLALLARLSGVPELIRLADRAAVPLVRRVIHHAIGVGLAVAIVGTSAPLFAASSTAWADPVGEPVVTMRVIDEGAPPAPITVVSTPSSASRDPAPGAPTAGVPEVRMILIEPAPEPESPPPPPTSQTSPLPGAAGPDGSSASAPAVSSPQPPPITAATPGDPSPASERSTPPTTTQAATTTQAPDGAVPGSTAPDAQPLTQTAERADETGMMWTIAPGDHLWHVAEQTLAIRWQRPPNDVETARYWRDLIEHNQDRLAHPGHADLVFPGQQFLLPPVPAA